MLNVGKNQKTYIYMAQRLFHFKELMNVINTFQFDHNIFRFLMHQSGHQKLENVGCVIDRILD